MTPIIDSIALIVGLLVTMMIIGFWIFTRFT